MFVLVEAELLIMTGRTPTPKKCRSHCSEESAIRNNSSHSHNNGACMQGAMVGWMSGSSDNSC